MKNTQEQLYAQWNSGQIAPVYLFHGQEEYQIDLLCDALVAKALEPGSADFNYDQLYGSEVDGARVVNIATSYPMMAERRVLMVKNVHQMAAQSLEMLAAYAKKPLESTCLILTAAKIDARRAVWQQLLQHSASCEVKPLYDNQVPDWLRRQVQAQGLTISEEAIRLLQGMAGSSLRQLASEIDKIRINLMERTRIEVADVERVAGSARQFSVFELCDAVGQRNIKSSLAILRHMLTQGEQPTGILAMLARHFLILAKLHGMQSRRLPQESLARALKVQPFFLGNYTRQAAHFNGVQLRQALQHLLEADAGLKSSYQKPALVLELVLVKLQSV